MAYTFKQYYITQIDYQHWAVSALLASLDTLDDDARRASQALYHDSLHRTLDVMLIVTRNWASRLKGENLTLGYEQPLCADWRELKNTLRTDLRGLQRFLEGQPEAFFDQQITYQGGNLSRSLWVRDALTHLTTELAHYRGQAAAVAVRLGAPMPTMEYVHYKRETEQQLAELRRQG